MTRRMTKYYPDKWCIVHVTPSVGGVEHYRVFASWIGGYANGDSWKLNSGIDAVEYTDTGYAFIGASGSVYYCNSGAYGSSMYGESVLDNLIASSSMVGITIVKIDEHGIDEIFKSINTQGNV